MSQLYVACTKGHVDAARLLLDNGAAVDRARPHDGMTPLWAACAKGQVDAARLLLDRGADVDRALKDGNTPLSIAKRYRHSSIVALLEEHQKPRTSLWSRVSRSFRKSRDEPHQK